MAGVEGLHALVTGGGRGIGAATAAALKASGAVVTVLGRDETMLNARVSAKEADGWVRADVTDEAALVNAIGEAASARGPVDILVNNAGGASTGPFAKSSTADLQRMLDVNLLGPASAMRVVLPGMIERNFGRVVSIASTASLKGYAYVSAYVAAKHALLGLTRAVALEVARTGVTVNAVCPGFTDTDLVSASVAEIVAKTGRTADSARAELVRNNPQQRLIEPAEVAEAVVFLARRESRSMTGVAMSLAGGEV